MKNRNDQDQDDERDYADEQDDNEQASPKKKKRRVPVEGATGSWKRYLRAAVGALTLIGGSAGGGGYYYYTQGSKSDNPLQHLKEAQTAVEQGAQKLAAGAPSVQEVLQDPQQAVGQFAENANQAFDNAAAQVQQSAEQAVGDFTQPAQQAVDQFAQDAGQAADQLAQDASQYGQQAVQAADSALAPRASIGSRTNAHEPPFDASQSLPPQESFPAAEPSQMAGAPYGVEPSGQMPATAHDHPAAESPPAASAFPTEAEQPSAFADSGQAAPATEGFTAPPEPSASPFATTPAAEMSPPTADAGELAPAPRSSRRRASVAAAPLAEPEAMTSDTGQFSEPTADLEPRTPPAGDFARPHQRTPQTMSADVEPSVTRSATAGTYTVEPQDNYWVISQKIYGNGAYFKALFEHNRDRYPRANRLRVGDVISTPPAETLAATYPQLMPRELRPAAASRDIRGAPVAVAPTGPRPYVVAEGDTLFDIARNELGDARRWSEIYELNRQTLGNNVDRLQPGTQLTLPGSEGSTVTNRTSRRLR
ncbi:MAG: LysM peptidoglycan-binding domain-containing protein [Pirellulales bacterium]|nr:LysM peptidoglycan-binding domain-containing protein [Pirellulales bacterium]